MKLAWRTQITGVLVALLCLCLNGCQDAFTRFSEVRALDERVNQFERNTLQIEKAMEEAQVRSIMGEPDDVVTADTYKLLSRLDATIVLEYFHPEYVIVSFVVGIREQKVTLKAMWIVGATSGALYDVDEYWEARLDR